MLTSRFGFGYGMGYSAYKEATTFISLGHSVTVVHCYSNPEITHFYDPRITFIYLPIKKIPLIGFLIYFFKLKKLFNDKININFFDSIYIQSLEFGLLDLAKIKIPIFYFARSTMRGMRQALQNEKIKISFLFIIISVVFWSIFNYLGDYFANIIINEHLSTIYTRLTYGASCAIAASFFYFVLIFPNKKNKITKVIIYPLIISSIFIAILNFTNLIVREVKVVNSSVYINTGSLFFVYIIYFSFWMLSAFIILVKKYVNSEGINKFQIQYLFLGTFISSLFSSLTNIVIPFLTGNFSISRYGPYFTIFFLSFTAYAIIKHRFMDIRLIIKRTTVYASTIIFILIIALALYWLETNFFANSIPPSIWGPLVLLFSLIIYNPLRKYFERIANKYFFTSLYNYQTTLEELGKQLTSTINLSEIVDSIINTIKSTMHLDRAGVLLYDKQSSNYKIYRTEGFTESNGISLVRC